MGPQYYTDEWITKTDDLLTPDICIYGGTAAGLAASVAASELGRRVLLLHPGEFLGGMTSGGLGLTDLGNSSVVGGISRRFYHLLAALFPQEGKQERWRFSPSMAQAALDSLLQGTDVTVRRYSYLDSITRGGLGEIQEIAMRGGLRVRAQQFIDATYEGDLMAAAGVPFAVGRESADTYNEPLNGFQRHGSHQFPPAIDPYVEPGKPHSGLLPGFRKARFLTATEAVAQTGKSDNQVQAYNFRVCMTADPANRRPFPRPDGYDPLDYELAARWIDTLDDPSTVFFKFDMVTSTKTDTNNHGAMSTDYVGGSREWPDGTYERREEIFQEHVRYQQGLHYFMANEQRVRSNVRQEYARWGLAADEFVETDGWPHQLYIREGRRMIADYVITQDDCQSNRICTDPVGLAAYNMDSHNCERLIVDGAVQNAGDVQVSLPRPYGISFRAIVPPRGSCPNLTVPVAISASHIAFGSVRMEPVFMSLGESAAVVSSLAIDAERSVQDVDYPILSEILLKRDQAMRSDKENLPHEGNP